MAGARFRAAAGAGADLPGAVDSLVAAAETGDAGVRVAIKGMCRTDG